MRKSLVALLLLTASSLAQAQVDFGEGYPDCYTMIRGDILRDISGKFLHQSQKWPELWHANPQIQNPHLICPDDTLSLVHVGGRPHLMLNRGESHGTIKLSPKIRSTPITEAIPTIPLDGISSSLLANRIVDSEKTFTSTSYIVAGNTKRTVNGTSDRIYARGKFAGDQPAYGIFHQGKVYTNPKTKEVLGTNVDNIDGGEVVATEDNTATLALARTTQEVHLGDRLFPTGECVVNSTFIPGKPSREMKGEIIDVPCGVTQIGQFDMVTLDHDQHDGLAGGNVPAIYKVGETMRDRVTGESVKIPDEHADLLMVFHTYKRLGYVLVPMASRSLSVTDRVQNPRLKIPASAGVSRFWGKKVSYDGFQDQDQTLPFFLPAMDPSVMGESR